MPKKKLAAPPSAAAEAWSLPAEYAYESPWGGEPLAGEYVFLDTETEVLPDLRRETPRAVLASASDGVRHCVLTVGQLSSFLLKHRYRRFVFWNIGFDYRVIQKGLGHGSFPGLRVLPDALADGRCHDAMLLEQLVRLAQGKGETGGDGEKFFRLALDQAARQYDTPLRVSKDNPYRKTFADLWALPGGVLSGVRGYYDYAVADTIVLAQLWNVLWPLSLKLAEDAGVEWPAVEKYGPLTEQIQVKASVALAQVSLNGVAFDDATALRLEAETRALYEERLGWLETNHPRLLKRYVRKDGGAYKVSKKTGAVEFNLDPMRALLAEFAAQNGFEPPRSKGKLGLLSAAKDDWLPYRGRSTLIDAWLSMSDRKKHLSFFTPFREARAKGLSRVHCDYDVLKRTGRTSCKNPNTQQIPKGGHFRDIFVAPPGKKLLTIDYSAVELCTLAAVLEQRYGKSRLAEVVRAYVREGGVDPHAYTAALVRGQSPEEFVALKASDPAKFKRERQAAKAVNFGLPGGLGPARLVEYAKNPPYCVDMTLEEATGFREKMLTVVYPELALYLGDNTLADWALNLAVPLGVLRQYCEGACRTLFRSGPDKLGMFLYCAGKVLQGDAVSARTGRAYDSDFCAKLWRFVRGAVELSSLPDAPDWRAACGQRLPSRGLYGVLFTQTAVTLTGRVRGGCGYTNSKNTPFQALAADGMKLALYDLAVRKGYKVCLMVHDELVVELDASTAERDAKEVEKVMVSEMEGVMEGRVPAACSYVISDKWEKG